MASAFRSSLQMSLKRSWGLPVGLCPIANSPQRRSTVGLLIRACSGSILNVFRINSSSEHMVQTATQNQLWALHSRSYHNRQKSSLIGQSHHLIRYANGTTPAIFLWVLNRRSGNIVSGNVRLFINVRERLTGFFGILCSSLTDINQLTSYWHSHWRCKACTVSSSFIQRMTVSQSPGQS